MTTMALGQAKVKNGKLNGNSMSLVKKMTFEVGIALLFMENQSVFL